MLQLHLEQAKNLTLTEMLAYQTLAYRNRDDHVWNHKQLAARKRWAEVDTTAGKVKAMMPPGMPDEFEPRMDAIPAIGEHTDAILTELGYEEEQIARLRESGAI